VFLLLDNFDILWIDRYGILAPDADRRRLAELLRWGAGRRNRALNRLRDYTGGPGKTIKAMKSARKANSGDYPKSFSRTNQGRLGPTGRGAGGCPAAGATSPTGTYVLGVPDDWRRCGLFLDNIGLFHFSRHRRLRPVALIAIGLSKRFETRGTGVVVWAARGWWVGLPSSWTTRHCMELNMIWSLGLIAIGGSHSGARSRNARRSPDPACSRRTPIPLPTNMCEPGRRSAAERRLATPELQGR